MKKFLLKIITLLCVLGSTSFLAGQEATTLPTEEFSSSPIDTRNFETAEWKKATKGIDYRNAIENEKKEEDKKSDDTTLQEKAEELGGAAGAFWNVLVKIVFVIFVVIVVGLLVYSIMRGENIFKKKKKVTKTTTFDLEEVETNLADSDLDQYIGEAESAGNYPLAIRLHYLAIIKALSRKKIIRYKKSKTNHVYVSKVSATSFGEDFRKATSVFERIWFGQNTFTQSDYQQIKPEFQKWIGTAQNLSDKKPTLNANTP